MASTNPAAPFSRPIPCLLEPIGLPVVSQWTLQETVMTLLIVAAVGMLALGAASWGLYSANRFRIPTL
jgi:hypothetical protein